MEKAKDNEISKTIEHGDRRKPMVLSIVIIVLIVLIAGYFMVNSDWFWDVLMNSGGGIRHIAPGYGDFVPVSQNIV